MRSWSADVVLADGATVHLRASSPADREAIVAFHGRQSTESTYRRYFSYHPTLTEADLVRFTEPDFVNGGVIVAIDGAVLMAIGGWYRWPDRTDADVAFQVDDAQQGRGVATLLLEHLAATARTAGVDRFTAETMNDNRAMLGVFTRAGWPVQRHFASGLVELAWNLADTSEYVNTVEDREQRADSRSMARFLLPRAIAIIGASDQAGSVGAAITSSVLDSDVAGPVYLVNPARTSVSGRPCVATLDDIDGPIDLALVVVPGSAVDGVVRACAHRRVRGAIVVTASEPFDRDLVAEARRFGLRLIGPASMGVISTSPGSPLNASLSIEPPRAGHVALSLQSGPLGAALLQQAKELQLGLSWFVSLGERSDVSGNDLLQFWEDDAETKVIAMYTERFGNPRKFVRIARRVARTRPIVAVEAQGDTSTDALYLQAGVIRVPTVADLLDTARVLEGQPLPAGPRVAVIANAASPDRLVRRALSAAGLEAVGDIEPLDWDADESIISSAVASALARGDVDSVLVVHTPPMPAAAASLGPTIEAAAAGSTKPVIAVLLGTKGPVVADGKVPGFAFPEPAVQALGRLWRYARWLQQESQATPVERPVEQAVIDQLSGLGGELDIATSAALLGVAGIPVPETIVVTSPDEAADSAERIGFPVVVKRTGQRPLGRSRQAGVALDLGDADAVRIAFEAVHNVDGDGPIVVQAMQHPGIEVRIEVFQHPALGPALRIGPGGQSGLVLGNQPERLLPLSPYALDDMLERSLVADLFARHDIDRQPLKDLIASVAQFATDYDDIAALVLDPVLVSATSCAVTDVKVRVERHDDAPLRQLDENQSWRAASTARAPGPPAEDDSGR